MSCLAGSPHPQVNEGTMCHSSHLEPYIAISHLNVLQTHGYDISGFWVGSFNEK